MLPLRYSSDVIRHMRETPALIFSRCGALLPARHDELPHGTAASSGCACRLRHFRCGGGAARSERAAAAQQAALDFRRHMPPDSHIVYLRHIIFAIRQVCLPLSCFEWRFLRSFRPPRQPPSSFLFQPRRSTAFWLSADFQPLRASVAFSAVRHNVADAMEMFAAAAVFIFATGFSLSVSSGFSPPLQIAASRFRDIGCTTVSLSFFSPLSVESFDFASMPLPRHEIVFCFRQLRFSPMKADVSRRLQCFIRFRFRDKIFHFLLRHFFDVYFRLRLAPTVS